MMISPFKKLIVLPPMREFFNKLPELLSVRENGTRGRENEDLLCKALSGNINKFNLQNCNINLENLF